MKKPLKPRPDQERAVASAVAGFVTHDRGQIHMPCGTGKTVVGFWVAEGLNARTILILVPSLALVGQTAHALRRNGISLLRVCSRHASIDTTTTSSKEIAEFFTGVTGRRLVIATYHSAPMLRETFDIAIFDEAHRTAGAPGKRFASLLHDSDGFCARRRLFLTATPRNSRPTIDAVSRPSFAAANVMDNTSVYGPVFHTLAFAAARDAKLVSDLQILVTVILDSQIAGDLGDPGVRRAALQVALARAMHKYDLRRAFSFHPCIADARAFADAGTALDGVASFHVNGRMSMKSRAEIFEEFEDSARGLVTSARCLSEGVDVPAVDLVCFTSAKRSGVDIVQTIGRAQRPGPGKTAYILLPVFVRNGEEDGLHAVDRTDFKHVYDVINALRTLDTTFAAGLAEAVKGKKLPRGITIEIPDGVADPALVRRLRRTIEVRILSQCTRMHIAPEAAFATLREMVCNKMPRPKERDQDKKMRYLALYLKRHPEIQQELAQIDPSWFVKSSEALKSEFLRRGAAGEPRPSFAKERKNANKLALYLKPGHRCYDPEFAAALRAAAPHWFGPRRTAAFEKLKAYAASGATRPPSAHHPDLEIRRLGWMWKSVRQRGGALLQELRATAQCGNWS